MTVARDGLLAVDNWPGDRGSQRVGVRELEPLLCNPRDGDRFELFSDASDADCAVATGDLRALPGQLCSQEAENRPQKGRWGRMALRLAACLPLAGSIDNSPTVSS